MGQLTEALRYAKTLGLEHLDWKYNGDALDEDTDHVLMIRWNYEQFSLEFGRHMAGNSFMSADDIGWSGPVRNIVISASVNIDEERKE